MPNCNNQAANPRAALEHGDLSWRPVQDVTHERLEIRGVATFALTPGSYQSRSQGAEQLCVLAVATADTILRCPFGAQVLAIADIGSVFGA
jgi:hypothetical protein